MGTKMSWTERETDILAEVSQQYTPAIGKAEDKMPHEWTKIAEEFNEKSGQRRTARQCRERWMNKIDPSITHEKFSVREDILILQLFLEFESKWHDLAQKLNETKTQTEDATWERVRRSEIQIKNRFKCLVCKGRGVEKLNELEIHKSVIFQMVAKLEASLDKPNKNLIDEAHMDTEQ